MSNPIFSVFSQNMVDPLRQTSIASAISMAIGLGIAVTSSGGYVGRNSAFKRRIFFGAAAGLLGAVAVWPFCPGLQPSWL